MLIVSRKNEILRSVLRVVGIYLAAAFFWILVSDAVIASLATSEAAMAQMQTYNGVAFVVVTATMLFLVLRREWNLRAEKEEQVRWQAELLNITHDAVIVRKWSDGRITFWNKGAERLYGWTAEEAVGSLSQDILYNGDGKEQRERNDRALVERGAWRGERSQKSKDGRDLVVDAHLTVVRDATGALDSVLCINTDVTQVKSLENQLRQARKEESMGEFAEGVRAAAH